MTVLVTLKKDRYLYLALSVKMALSVLLDAFLVSNLSVSVRLGVNGIAITNIIVNALLFVCAVCFYREKISVCSSRKNGVLRGSKNGSKSVNFQDWNLYSAILPFC